MKDTPAAGSRERTDPAGPLRRGNYLRSSIAVPKLHARGWSKLDVRVALGCLMLLGLVLRVAGRDHGLFRDEFFTVEDVRPKTFSRFLSQMIEGPEMTPPMYFALLWPVSKVGRPDLWWTLPSLIPGVLLIPVLFGLGRRVSGDPAGLIAAAVGSVAPAFLVFSVELRPYMLLAFLACLSTLILLEALEFGSAGWWCAYAVTGGLVLWTHYTGAFVLAGQGLWVLATRVKARARLVLASFGSLLLFSPWLPELRSKGAMSWYADANPWNVVALAKTIPGEQFMPPPAVRRPDYLGWRYLLLYGFWILLAALLAAAIRHRVRTDGRASVGVVAAAALSMPLAMGLQAILTGDGVFTPRHLFVFAPYAAVLIGWSLVTVGGRSALAFGLPMAAIIVLGTASHYSQAARKPAYWQAAQLIAAKAEPKDLVVDALPGIGRRLESPLEYLRPRLTVGHAEALAPLFVYEAGLRGPHVWLVFQTTGGRRPAGAIARFKAHGFRVRNQWTLLGSSTLRVLELRQPR